MLKENGDIFADYICGFFNESIKKSTFSSILKNANITPVFKNTKYQCGFRKGFSAQHCLLAMLEKWNNAVGKGQVFGALLTDLSKAFDSLPHELITAKLNVYGFNLPALKLMHSYLSHRKNRTKKSTKFMGGNTIWRSTRLYT